MQEMSSESSDSELSVDVLDDDLTEARQWEDLAAIRAELDGSVDSRLDDFRIAMRMDTGHDTLNCFTGQCNGDHVVQWCRDRRIPFTSRYGRDKFGPAFARTMCAAWCHKMQFFFNLAHVQGEPLREFAIHEVNSYVYQSTFIRERDEILGRLGCRARVVQLERLFQ